LFFDSIDELISSSDSGEEDVIGPSDKEVIRPTDSAPSECPGKAGGFCCFHSWRLGKNKNVCFSFPGQSFFSVKKKKKDPGKNLKKELSLSIC
jgi:hypothetical protein